MMMKIEIFPSILLSIAVTIFFMQREIYFIKIFINYIFNGMIGILIMSAIKMSMITVREITKIKSAARSHSRHEKYLCLSKFYL